MDIFRYAEKFDADYYEQGTGYIYKVQDYNRAVKLGIPTKGIVVCDLSGNIIGVAIKKES